MSTKSNYVILTLFWSAWSAWLFMPFLVVVSMNSTNESSFQIVHYWDCKNYYTECSNEFIDLFFYIYIKREKSCVTKTRVILIDLIVTCSLFTPNLTETEVWGKQNCQYQLDRRLVTLSLLGNSLTNRVADPVKDGIRIQTYKKQGLTIWKTNLIRPKRAGCADQTLIHAFPIFHSVSEFEI